MKSLPFLLLLLIPLVSAAADDTKRLNELDAYWAEVSRAVAAGAQGTT